MCSLIIFYWRLKTKKNEYDRRPSEIGIPNN